ncbi:hypothetical protein NDU88_005868 [Pleurodeles waltl]|uniref:Uncharacterized protein n=1 Tax=Pleurodeles waltl TaxID=8319 RepID=A0AAV7UJY5_PLEWA|nr:hypothetical protein NDU88_005868 [Pleurodeles waltl]
MMRLLTPCTPPLGPKLRALTAIQLLQGPVSPGSTWPGPPQADPPWADCPADSRALPVPVHRGALSPQGPGANRSHLTAASASHRGPLRRLLAAKQLLRPQEAKTHGAHPGSWSPGPYLLRLPQPPSATRYRTPADPAGLLGPLPTAVPLHAAGTTSLHARQ